MIDALDVQQVERFVHGVRAAFSFDDATLAVLARNSFEACFVPAGDKARWQAEVDAWLAPKGP